VVIVTTSSADVDLDVVNPATCEEDADKPAVEHIMGSTVVELFRGSLRQAIKVAAQAKNKMIFFILV